VEVNNKCIICEIG